MSLWRRQAGAGLAAALLASALVTSLVGTALAVTTSNTDPSVTVPTGTPTSVGISYTWTGTPTDTLVVGTTFAITLPAGYAWTVPPTLIMTPTSTATFSGPVASNGGLTQTWTLATFASGASWSLALAGGTVVTTSTSGTSSVTLSVGGGAAVEIARLTASGVTAGSVVPITVSPTSVPANGTSTITIRFGSMTATCSNDTAFTISTTGGVFSATTLPGVTIPSAGTTSVMVACANFAAVGGTTLTLLAPSSPRNAVIAVVLTPATPATGPVVDSTTKVTFSPVNTGKGGHGKPVPAGARKVAFYAATSAATGCAAAAAQPVPGAKSYGFAILTSTGHGKLNVTVSLKGAMPDATYAVTVEQSPGSCSTSFNVRTNAVGNGNGHIHLNAMAGATSFWVTATSGSSTLVTRAAAFSLKKAHGPKDKDVDTGKGHGRG